MVHAFRQLVIVVFEAFPSIRSEERRAENFPVVESSDLSESSRNPVSSVQVGQTKERITRSEVDSTFILKSELNSTQLEFSSGEVEKGFDETSAASQPAAQRLSAFVLLKRERNFRIRNRRTGKLNRA